MQKAGEAIALGRRQLLAGAVFTACSAAISTGKQTVAQTAVPTPVPVRVQVPDLAFADALQQALASYSQTNDAYGLTLSIVPAEPAPGQLLNDVRSGARRYSGALVPNWLIPDLVRDDFILTASPPPDPLPAAVAQLRSFGGEWVATDLDHDCDLLYCRLDLLGNTDFQSAYIAATGSQLLPAETWDELQLQATFFAEAIGGGIALPQSRAQQAVDHFASMAASFVIDESNTAAFWFDPETMVPAISSDAHQQALETWRQLALTTPDTIRSGSSGDLWQAFLDGAVAYLIASADFLPFALERGADPGVIGIAALPGRSTSAGELIAVGNTTGASWGGVVMRSSSESAMVADFLGYLSTADVQDRLWVDSSTGVTPSVTTETLSGVSQTLISAGWPESTAAAWTQSILATQSNPLQLPALRIAETRRYLRALEERIVSFLSSGTGSARETLELAADDWNQINEAIGVEVQRDLYSRSLMPPPAVAGAFKTR